MKFMLNKTFRSIPALIAVLIVAISSSNAQIASPSGLVAWYAGDGDFRDISGNGFDATPAVAPLAPTFLIGKSGEGFSVDGSAQRATVTDSAAFRPQSFTIEGWLRPTNGDGVARVAFGKTIGSGFFNSYALYSFGTTLRGSVCDASACVELIAPTTINVWHHVAFTFDDPGGASTKTARIYVDGVLAASQATAIAPAYDNHPVVIGCDIDNESFGAGWLGGIDELAFYNRPLALGEIQSIFAAGVNGKTKQAATNSGLGSTTRVGDAVLTFDNVVASGVTSAFAINTATAGTLPSDQIPTRIAYDFSTSASFAGNVEACFVLPALSQPKIATLRVFHREGSSLVDRTTSVNVAANTVCGRATSLSQFVVAGAGVRRGQLVYQRFQANAASDGTIWALFPNGTDEHFISTGSNPRVSADGRYMAFKRKRLATADLNQNYGLWVLDMSTGDENEIYYNADFLAGFDFTTDSQNLLFDWGCSIYTIGVNGGNAASVVAGDCFSDHPTPNPLDGKVAFHTQSGIFTVDSGGGNRQQVPNTGVNDLLPSWSKNGEFLAYVHYDGVSAAPYVFDVLYKIKPDGSGKTVLKSLTGADRFGLIGAWSADGSTIYMPALIGGVSGIYAVATDGSGTMSLAPGSDSLIAAGSSASFVGFIGNVTPTAARVAVGGRVSDGKNGVARARVTLTDAGGVSRSVTTGTFGNFRFEGVEVGGTYVVEVAAKRYTFAPRVISVDADLTELDFTALN